MPWKSVAIAAALALGAANMSTDTALGRGMSGGAHFAGGGFAGHRFMRPAIASGFATRRRFFVRPFRRSFATGGFWPYWPYDYYDYSPTAAYGDATTATYPGTDGCLHRRPSSS